SAPAQSSDPRRRNGPRAVSYEGDGEVGRPRYRDLALTSRSPLRVTPPSGRRAPAGALRLRLGSPSLWGRIGIRAAEDVAVSEGRRAVLLRGRPRNARVSGGDRLPPRVHGRTIRCSSRVVPDGCAVRPGCGGVDVVT